MLSFVLRWAFAIKHISFVVTFLYFLGICAILISVSVGALVLASGFIIIIEMFFASNN